MFYVTMHTTHFIYSYMEGRKRTQHILFTVIWKKGNVLFNDALNTFYLRLYGRKLMFYLTTQIYVTCLERRLVNLHNSDRKPKVIYSPWRSASLG